MAQRTVCLCELKFFICQIRAIMMKMIMIRIQEYLEASRKGELNETVVDNLLYAIEEMDAKNLGKDIELLIPAKQLAELISSIFTYTEMLAKVNEYKAKVKRPKSGTDGNIISLKQYLEIQKQILQESA